MQNISWRVTRLLVTIGLRAWATHGCAEMVVAEGPPIGILVIHLTMKPKRVWKPQYTITPPMARFLMEIEASKEYFESHPLAVAVEVELRYQARLRSTHYSTQIEGNRLTLAEAVEVIEKKHTVRGKERDVREVQNYWNALLKVEQWATAKTALSENLIRRIHALVHSGPRSKSSPYRDGQNVIRDSSSGGIVYLPPEAKDVPDLMTSLVAWCHSAEKALAPVPIIAGLAHYQFVTIHPYYDGNGRTGRLLATFLLHCGGYGLHGFFSLEEHYAKDLSAYYQALVTHPHQNYYEGRADADLTSWLEYFIPSMAAVFTEARKKAEQLSAGRTDEPKELRSLDPRARIVIGLFTRNETISTGHVAKALGLSERMARVLIAQWLMDGWLVATSPARRNRAYSLSATYRQYVGNGTAAGVPGNKG